VGVSELLAHPGTRRVFHDDVALDGLAISTASVPEGSEVTIDLTLESIGSAITATGTVAVDWTGACRRCLTEVTGRAESDVREIFEPDPVEGETYLLAGDQIDLESMVRDAVLLALPLAPLCESDCRGPAPETFPTGPEEDAETPIDPRWAALSQLDFDE
jgi:uncharacterized protein